MPAYGTAPRKTPNGWVTRTGRRLSADGQRYWDRQLGAGKTDGKGHMLAGSNIAKATAQTAPPKKPSFSTIAKAKKGDPTAVRDVKAYMEHEEGIESAKSFREQKLAESYDTQIPKGAYKYPKAAEVVADIFDPVEAGKRAVHAAKEGNIPMAALEASAILPFGPGKGARAARAAAKTAKGTEIVPKAAKGAQEVLPVASREAQEVAGAFSGAKSGRAAQDVRRSQEFQRRVSKVGEEFEKAGGGMAGHYAKKRAMGGEYEKIQFNDLLTWGDEQMNTLADEIEALPHLMDMEKVRLVDAVADAIKGVMPQPNQIALMKKAFGEKAALEFADTGKTPIGDAITNILNIPRAVMASGDLSAPFRQGLMAFAMNPVISAKQLPKMFRDFASESHYQRGIGGIHADPAYEDSVRAGVSYTELGPKAATREEQFGSTAAETLTGVGALVGKGKGSGSFVRMSGRAYTGFLDRVRLEMYKTLREEALARGRDLQRVHVPKGGTKYKTTLDEDIGALVNWATGRGQFKHRHIEGAAPLLNATLFSPRLFKSRLDALNPQFYRRLDPFARKKALNGVIRLVATGVGILTIAKELGGADVELDPRSSDWGKIRFGDSRYDIWGGYQQVARAIAQEITQESKSSASGNFRNLRGEGETFSFDPMVNLMKGKASPPVALAMDIHKGEMFGGKPVTAWNEAKEKLSPILWQDLVEAVRDGDWANASAMFGFGSFGVGAQRYGSPKKKPAKSVWGSSRGGAEKKSVWGSGR